MNKKTVKSPAMTHRFQDEWLVRAVSRLPLPVKNRVDLLRRQKKTLLSRALLQSGVCTPEQLGKAVQTEYGIPFIQPDRSTINKHALRLVPKKICQLYKLFPIRLSENLLEIITANPTDLSGAENVHAFSGRDVSASFALPETIDALIAEFYPETASDQESSPKRPIVLKPIGNDGAELNGISQTEHRSDGKNTILLADDNDAMRLLLKMILEKRGFAVEEAEDGDIALEKAASVRPDLMILDLNMPRLNGRNVLEQLQSGTAVCPVIVLTGTPDETAHEELLNLGADDFLMKPFKPNLLLSRIKTTLRRAAK